MTLPKSSREWKYQHLLYADILRNQQTDKLGQMTDTLLICNGGNIRAHAFILEGASHFFWTMFMSQGKDYPFTREILLPDFHVREIEALLTLLYKGYVELPTEEHLQRLQETLNFFKIGGVEPEESHSPSRKLDRSSVKVETDWNRIPPEIMLPPPLPEMVNTRKRKSKKKVAEKSAPKKPNEPSTSKASLSSNSGCRSSGSSISPRRRGKVSYVELESDKSEDDDSVNTEDDDCMTPVRKRVKKSDTPASRKQRQTSAAVVEIVEVEPSSAPPTPPQSEVAAPAPAPPPEVKDGSEPDSEDEDWTEPEYKDPAWFNTESCRCHCCGKKYDTMSDAARCVTVGHKHVRCYFCFRAYSSVNVLHQHLKKRHEPGWKEGTVKCPYCGDQFPYKNVSTHVIGQHLCTGEHP